MGKWYALPSFAPPLACEKDVKVDRHEKPGRHTRWLDKCKSDRTVLIHDLDLCVLIEKDKINSDSNSDKDDDDDNDNDNNDNCFANWNIRFIGM